MTEYKEGLSEKEGRVGSCADVGAIKEMRERVNLLLQLPSMELFQRAQEDTEARYAYGLQSLGLSRTDEHREKAWACILTAAQEGNPLAQETMGIYLLEQASLKGVSRAGHLLRMLKAQGQKIASHMAHPRPVRPPQQTGERGIVIPLFIEHKR